MSRRSRFTPGSSFNDVLQARLSRRQVLQGGLIVAATGLTGSLLGCAGATGEGVTPSSKSTTLGFKPVPVSSDDALRIPEGYRADVLYRWGDPVGATAGMPAFRMDASNSADDQALQAGMHHDGMQFFPLPQGATGSDHGLLVMNHEYYDPNMLTPDGARENSREKVRKAMHSVGVSVIEITRSGERWQVNRPSRYARRIHAATRVQISGPAAGAPIMRTALDPSGREGFGTFAGCAHGWTPWGTYLTCEENFQFMFFKEGQRDVAQTRYDVSNRPRYRWFEHDERFDTGRHPNEFHRFGWVVEIDPFNPVTAPVKRTAMGRFSHEGACPLVGRDGRVAFYMGDDRAFEYIYKYVTRDAWNPNDRGANREMLDHGTLYVARFDADGSGTWLPLVFGQNGLTAANGFASQADVLVRARLAADVVGATPMDRPEWCAVHPDTGEVYCTLTNNSGRGRAGQASADSANPRANNVFGHIIRWREDGSEPGKANVGATRFKWDVFAMGGDPESADPAKRGRFSGDAFGSPDGLFFDRRGVLWVETDISPTALNAGDYARLGNNAMFAVDPATGAFRRFLTGPRGAEITGLTSTPDGQTFFVNIQHPGEGPKSTDPVNPRQYSNWPDFDAKGRPRSSTVVIRKIGGGIVGS